MTNAINKCQNCYQGPFPTFTELLKHLAFNHPESIGKKCALNKQDQFILNAGHYWIKFFILSLDKFTNKLGLSSTLKPITNSNEDVPMDGTGVPEEEEVCFYILLYAESLPKKS